MENMLWIKINQSCKPMFRINIDLEKWRSLLRKYIYQRLITTQSQITTDICHYLSIAVVHVSVPKVERLFGFNKQNQSVSLMVSVKISPMSVSKLLATRKTLRLL